MVAPTDCIIIVKVCVMLLSVVIQECQGLRWSKNRKERDGEQPECSSSVVWVTREFLDITRLLFDL